MATGGRPRGRTGRLGRRVGAGAGRLRRRVGAGAGRLRRRVGTSVVGARTARSARRRSSPGEDELRRLRARLAELADALGDWEEARRLLEENVASDPGHGPAHRQLARVAHRRWQWHGHLEGAERGLEGLRFRPLAGPAAPGEADPGTVLLQRAHEALERAVALEPARWAWRGALGELREAVGDLEGAIACYEAMVERESTSSRRAAFRALHEWQFALERARHRAGAPRVEDPLFDARALVPADEVVVPGEHPAGLFDARWTFGGLAVTGLVTAPGVDRVDVVLDDLVLRTVSVASGVLPKFGQAVQREALAHVPPTARLRVLAPDGAPLLARGRAHALELTVPHGTGRLAGILAGGGRLDKKGGFEISPERLRERQDDYLRLYEAARGAFEELVGPLLLIHGTLLGVHREGDFIPGDDDFDVAYVSACPGPVAVKEEAKRLMLALVRAGFTVSFNRSGRLFRVALDSVGDDDLHLDVHPMWFEDGRVWLHNDVSVPADVDDFLPPGRARLGGRPVAVPRRPEVFLAGHYGPGWRVPDPGFMNHRSAVPPAVLSHLGRALLTPDEHRELDAEARRLAAEDPRAGRLVSIGSQPLYPLGGVRD